MTSRYLLTAIAIAASCGTSLLSQVQEVQQVVDVDLAGSNLAGTGIRVLKLPCKLKLEHGRPLTGYFLVVADSNTKTYWWAIIPDSAPSKAGRFSKDFARYHIEKTPSGFRVFYLWSTNIAIAASRGRYDTDVQLAALVKKDFDATAGDRRVKGFAFVDGYIKLRSVLPAEFFFLPLSPVISQPKLGSATRLANGNWELAVSSPAGKIAYLNLAARDFSVVSHRMVDR